MITPDEISSAHARITPHVRHTPVIDPGPGAFGLGARLSLKLELLQHTGSFKPRGAFATLTALAVPASGVVAASGGNHGAAVAYAAKALGHPAHIFVPETSPEVKVARIRSLGAVVHVGGARYADAFAAAEHHARETGALVVHAYDAPMTLAGQGTVAREWEEDVPDLDTVLVAVGGGGLIGGMAAWWRGRIRVIGVEPAGSCALHAALAAGEPVDVPVNSIAADSLGAKRAGDLAVAIARDSIDRVVLVEDEAIVAAQTALWRELRLATEPGGAAALAALVSGAFRPAPGEKVGVLVCGANVDPAMIRT